MRNLLNFLPQPPRMISWHLDKFHDFPTLFVFYKILKQFVHKFVVMFHEQDVRNFLSFPGFNIILTSVTWISFLHSFFPLFESLAVQIWLIPKKSIKWNKLTKYIKQINKCVKFEHVVSGPVWGQQKKFGGQKWKKNILPNVKQNTRQIQEFAECQTQTLGKDQV
jgi:hypothetical protein